MIRGLILDYGEVLSLPQPADALARMAAAAQTAAQVVCGRVLALSRRLRSRDAGTRVLAKRPADARAGSRQADDIQKLIALDVRSWTALSRRGLGAGRAAARGGVRTAVLSNGVPEIMEVIERERAISSEFDAVVVSYEVGCAKPDAAIFELTLDRLGVAAADALFVDDREANLEGARRVGPADAALHRRTPSSR